MVNLWKIDYIPKPLPENQPYAGSQEKVFQLTSLDAYVKDIHGSMQNPEHPMKGTGKFEWETPAYT